MEKDKVKGAPPLRVLQIGPAAFCRGGIASVMGTLCEGLPPFGMEVVRIASQDDRSRWRKLWSAVRGVLVTLCHAWRADVAHVHTSSYYGFMRKCFHIFILHAFGCPTVLHVHAGRFGPFLDSRGPLFHRWIFKPLVRRCKLVVALSQGRLDEFSRHLPRVASAVVPNPCMRPLAPTPQRRPVAQEVLFVGWIEDSKGVFELIEAVARLQGRFPGLRLVLAGHGRIADCQELARRLGVERQVELPGWLDDARMMEAYARADIFCLPSHVEGMPMSLLEAMGQAMPCIASKVGAIPEIMSDGVDGLLFEPKDIDGLQRCLEALLSDSGLRERLAAAAWERIRLHHSPEEFCAQMARHLRQAAQADAQPVVKGL